MENMRSILRRQLGRSLHNLPEMDRLAAAWPVACGIATARHGELISFDEGILHILVSDPIWFAEMNSRRSILQHDLARIAAVKLTGIHFTLKGERPPFRKRVPAQE